MFRFTDLRSFDPGIIEIAVFLRYGSKANSNMAVHRSAKSKWGYSTHQIQSI